ESSLGVMSLSEKNWSRLTGITGVVTFVLPFLVIFTLGDASNGYNLTHVHLFIKIVVMAILSISGFLFVLSVVRKETGEELKFMTFVWTILIIVGVVTFLSIIHSIRGV